MLATEALVTGVILYLVWSLYKRRTNDEVQNTLHDIKGKHLTKDDLQDIVTKVENALRSVPRNSGDNGSAKLTTIDSRLETLLTNQLPASKVTDRFRKIEETLGTLQNTITPLKCVDDKLNSLIKSGDRIISETNQNFRSSSNDLRRMLEDIQKALSGLSNADQLREQLTRASQQFTAVEDRFKTFETNWNNAVGDTRSKALEAFDKLHSTSSQYAEILQKMERARIDADLAKGTALEKEKSAAEKERQANERNRSNDAREVDLNNRQSSLDSRVQQLVAEEAEHDKKSEDLKQRLESFKNEQAALAERSQQVEAREKAARAEIDAANSTLKTAEEVRKDAQTQVAKAETLLGSFWPTSFTGTGRLAPHRHSILGHVHSSDLSAGLLFSSLYRYQLLIRADDSSEMKDALSDLGKRAYSYWKARGLSVQESFDQATQWAAALNEELHGHFKIKVPRPGVPKENWMSYTQGGPVVSVDGWAVFNSADIVLRRAEVV